jgi:Family of unknown function (DUF6353)
MLGGVDKALGQFLSQNATILLTGVGCVGTVATAVLAGRGAFQAAHLIEEQVADNLVQIRNSDVQMDNPDPDLTTREKVELVWPKFVPAVAMGTLTVASIVLSHRMSAQRAAALAAAYGLSESRHKEYKEKIAAKLGKGKEETAREEIVQDHVSANTESNSVTILTDGDVLCYDMLTDRYFTSSAEKIMRAENKITADIYHHEYASLSSFYDDVGLKATSFTDEMGWNSNNPIEVHLTSAMTKDKRPCLAIEFTNHPSPTYNRPY